MQVNTTRIMQRNTAPTCFREIATCRSGEGELLFSRTDSLKLQWEDRVNLKIQSVALEAMEKQTIEPTCIPNRRTARALQDEIVEEEREAKMRLPSKFRSEPKPKYSFKPTESSEASSAHVELNDHCPNKNMVQLMTRRKRDDTTASTMILVEFLSSLELRRIWARTQRIRDPGLRRKVR
ncbi:hypothetical protein C8R44DRAFT_733181 [Mycena epipterygia]|nr:hypothetical protein C8R44DRAFT_733181 [Mycena epipterygia]